MVPSAPRHIAAAALTAALLAVTGCGGGGSRSSPASEPSLAQAAAAVANLQLAASDLVRETSYDDAAGAKRAYAAFNRLFKSTRPAIDAKAPELGSKIEDESTLMRDAIGGEHPAEASREATALQQAVNLAASVVTGKRAGTKRGLLAILTQMKAAARDLSEEAKNRDTAGTRRAYAAFANLFAASRKRLAAKNSGAVETIETGLGKVQAALRGKDDAGQIEATTGDLLTAVDAIAAKTK